MDESTGENQSTNETGEKVKDNEPVFVGWEQKIWEYLKEHKTPVPMDTLGKRFIISKSTVKRIMAMLERNELVDVIKIGSKKYYKRREQ